MILEALSSVQAAVRVHWGNMVLVLQAQHIRYLFISSLSVLLLAVGGFESADCGLRPCKEADVLSAVRLTRKSHHNWQEVRRLAVCRAAQKSRFRRLKCVGYR